MSNINYNIPFAPTILIPGNSNNDTKNVETLKVQTLTDGTSTLTGDKFTNLVDPVSSTDIATKNYVDTVSSPLLNTISTISASSNTTYTSSQVTGGTILRDPNNLYTLDTWIAGTGGPSNSWEDITWSPELSLFVAVSDTGTADRVITSPDGITWTSRTTPDKSWKAVTWSSELGIFCAVSFDGSSASMTSSDGITWTSFAMTNGWFGIAWSPQLELFCATRGALINTSPDGETWTTRTAPSVGNCIDWSPELGIFCSTNSTTSSISSDGITWTTHTIVSATNSLAISWSPELEIFCATATDSVLISPDGQSWTSHSTNTTGSWCDVIWAAEVSLFLITKSGSTCEVSPDGINWTSLSITNTTNCSIGWSGELKRMAVTSQNGAKIYSDALLGSRVDSFPTVADIVTELGSTATVGYTLNTFIQNIASHISDPENLLTVDLTSTGLSPIQTNVAPDTTPTLATSAILVVSITLTNVGSGTEAAEYIYWNSIYQNEMMTVSPISNTFRLSDGILLPNTTVYKTNITSTITGGITYTLGQVINTVLDRNTTVVGTNDILPSKETLNIGDLQNNDTYTFVVRNIGTETLTISPNTGTTIDPNSVIDSQSSLITLRAGESSTISLIYDISSETFIAYPIINSTF